LAGRAGVELVHVGDRDAFGVIPEVSAPEFVGVVGVHPMVLIQALKNGKMAGVFENISRPGLDGKPQFSVGRLVVVSPVCFESRETK